MTRAHYRFKFTLTGPTDDYRAVGGLLKLAILNAEECGKARGESLPHIVRVSHLWAVVLEFNFDDAPSAIRIEAEAHFCIGCKGNFRTPPFLMNPLL